MTELYTALSSSPYLSDIHLWHYSPSTNAMAKGNNSQKKEVKKPKKAKK